MIKDLKYDNERCLRICEGACLNIEKNQCNCSDGVIERMLDELLQYREIGTVAECREAVEKQEAKNIIRIAGRYPYKCPTCNGKLEIGYKHCIICGQSLRYQYENLEEMEDE